MALGPVLWPTFFTNHSLSSLGPWIDAVEDISKVCCELWYVVNFTVSEQGCSFAVFPIH